MPAWEHGYSDKLQDAGAVSPTQVGRLARRKASCAVLLFRDVRAAAKAPPPTCMGHLLARGEILQRMRQNHERRHLHMGNQWDLARDHSGTARGSGKRQGAGAVSPTQVDHLARRKAPCAPFLRRDVRATPQAPHQHGILCSTFAGIHFRITRQAFCHDHAKLVWPDHLHRIIAYPVVRLGVPALAAHLEPETRVVLVPCLDFRPVLA